MYEIGKKRIDGKFNIWKKTQLGPHHWDWMIDLVADSSSEADYYVNQKIAETKRHYKVNQK